MERTSGSVAESFRLPVTPAAAGMARERLAEACAGLDDEQRYVAELLTSELVTNAVRHPQRPDDGPWARIVEVAIHRSDRCLRVEVCDPDPRPLKAPSCPSTPRESGWGLYLLSQLSTEWGCSSAEAGAGKVVWFEMGISPRG
ncbi:MAG TPA: ATP-binding protein [Nocardioidaceae bacterium]|nr:ATP-binding protein [Nocardioidaceae bacterium]